MLMLTKNAIGMLVAKYKAVLRKMLINSCLTVFICAAPTAALAAEVEVINTDDDGPGSLRSAVSTANPGDAIKFSAGLDGKTILLESPIIIDKNLSFVVPDNITVSITRTGNVGPLLLADGDTVLDFSSPGLVIKNGYHSQLGSDSYVYGGGIYAGSITTFAGELKDNTVSSTNEAGNASAFGGGIYTSDVIDAFSGKVVGNAATAVAGAANRALAGGGGIRAYSITAFTGEVTGNTVTATSSAGRAQAIGGGLEINKITPLAAKLAVTSFLPIAIPAMLMLMEAGWILIQLMILRAKWAAI